LAIRVLTNSSLFCNTLFMCFFYAGAMFRQRILYTSPKKKPRSVGSSPAGRLMQADRQPHVVEVRGLHIDRRRFEVKIGSHELRLSKKEFELLWVLASEDGRAFRRGELIDRVWGRGYFIDTRTVDVHIARLRTKLKAIPGDAPSIETVWGIGYRLRAAGET
jgi:DNA-binding response OmpR family regulator